MDENEIDRCASQSNDYFVISIGVAHVWFGDTLRCTSAAVNDAS